MVSVYHIKIVVGKTLAKLYSLPCFGEESKFTVAIYRFSPHSTFVEMQLCCVRLVKNLTL